MAAAVAAAVVAAGREVRSAGNRRLTDRVLGPQRCGPSRLGRSISLRIGFTLNADLPIIAALGRGSRRLDPERTVLEGTFGKYAESKSPSEGLFR